MRFLTLLLVGLVASGAYALDVEAAIAQMDAAGRKTVVGTDADCGSYVLCRAEAEVEKDINRSREQAKLEARSTIAELVAVKISNQSSQTTTTKLSTKGEQEEFEQSEFSKSVTRKDVDQVQRGLSVCKEVRKGSKLVVYCLLTSKVMDATAALTNSVAQLGPNTVRATGVGYCTEIITEDKAHALAVNEAQRNAIAQVMGMSMVNSTAQQVVSKADVDKNGDEDFVLADTFKCRVFSASAGFIKTFRELETKKTGNAICVVIVATVARDEVMKDYRAYLESMGNPGFCVRSNDSALISACSGFFGGFGLRMVGNVRDAAYIFDAIGTVEGGMGTLTVTFRDKINKNVLLSSAGSAAVSGSASATYLTVFSALKTKLHGGIDECFRRFNADGRKVVVRLCNYDDDYQASVRVVKYALENVPGAKNVRKLAGTSDDTVEFSLNYIGDTEDLADFLDKHIQTDIKRKRLRPQKGRVENTLVEFDFE